MTRVIHTGDTHLGYRQYHSPERRADFLAAFRRVVEDAIADDIDAVIHAGDLFHDRRPDLRDLLGTIDVLRTLADADIPFLAIVGNHEGTRDGQWIDLFERLDLATHLDERGVSIGNTTFYGLDYVPPSQRDRLDYAFEPNDTENAALVAHGLFEPFAHADWDTEALLDDATVDFDALLLADNHTPGTAEVSGTWVTYPGSTERVSAAEREDRGYNLVEFDGEVRISRRGLDVTREFAFIDVDLADGEGIDRLRERVRQFDLDGAVALVTIDGGGKEVAPAAIEEFALERGALVARVNDRREIEVDSELTVRFADPDEAVRERVRDLGLSEAARDIDETVRASKVADTNVREEVETRIRTLIDEDVSAFEAADPVIGDRTNDGKSGTRDGDDGRTNDGKSGTHDGDDERTSGEADAEGNGVTGTSIDEVEIDVDDEPVDGEQPADVPAVVDDETAGSDVDETATRSDGAAIDHDDPEESEDGDRAKSGEPGQTSIGEFR